MGTAYDARMPRKRKRGRRGKGTVYWDGTAGCWVAVLSIGTADGRRIRRKARGRDEDDAYVQLDRLQLAHRAGVDPAKGTLDRYLKAWLDDHRTSTRESTADSYDNHIRLHISPLLGGITLTRLQPSDVRRLKADRLKAGLAPATVQRILTTLRIALGQAVRDRILPDSPAEAVSLPRVEREPVEPMTEETADAILAAVRGSWIEPLVILLLGSGMRVGEALGLDWRDVDLERGHVIVRRSKTKVRAVPISDDAVEALATLVKTTKRYGPNEPVFLGQRTHKRLRRDSILHLYRLLLDEAGLPKITIHQLRHGVATMLVTQGVHMRVIAEQLGHANPSLTAKTYAHVVPESQREAVGLLNRKKETG